MARSVTAARLAATGSGDGAGVKGGEMPLLRTLPLFALLLCGCAGPGTDGAPGFRDRLLAAIPGDARVVVPVDFSADGRRAAWVMQRGETSRAVCGGWMGKPYGVVC